MASIGGNKVIVYTCEVSNNFYTHAIYAIDLLKPFRMLYHGTNKSLNILGIPSLSKQLHQMEIQVQVELHSFLLLIKKSNQLFLIGFRLF